MKILIIVDDYLPDSIKIAAKMMHELALQFIKEGNEVSVLTPGKKVKELKPINHLSIHRFRSGKIKNTSKLRRVVNESLLSFRAYLYYFFRLRNKKQDLIIYYSPSIFFGPLVQAMKKHWGCPSYLILRDFFPQWAIDQNIIKEGSAITRYFRFFERLNYQAADFIALQSPNNLEWFYKNVNSNKTLGVLYNWTNEFKDKGPLKSKIDYRAKLKLTEKVVFFYGGNMGKSQDMMNLVRLAQNMQKYPSSHFVFVGLGDEVELVKKAIIDNELSNVNYLGAVVQNEYDKMLSDFDVGLFSLHKLHSSHNFPGKLLGYMANEMPILGSVNPGNDLQEIVQKSGAGFITLNGKDKELLNNAIELLNNETIRMKMGKNGMKLIKSKFSTKNATKKILEDIALHNYKTIWQENKVLKED
ncbi:glycosyltransferase family 4 protein [Flagellimonas sp. 389]|uniref:glycosyltransferase family 4 protein n=1 Tax=Flagellimonas sp. 389 TaxID=2835862 RepID=UPI001BD2BFBF|nr:glycosyltransferase family 4 protein [Flagellimonas sp. 389]MBS9461260.1 glycosyltransferase family 4 protein [Flagellimonas sp. 389]